MFPSWASVSCCHDRLDLLAYPAPSTSPIAIGKLNLSPQCPLAVPSRASVNPTLLSSSHLVAYPRPCTFFQMEVVVVLWNELKDVKLSLETELEKVNLESFLGIHLNRGLTGNCRVDSDCADWFFGGYVLRQLFKHCPTQVPMT
ncbi:hypothetical protein J6590_086547 [Homalodisca vitripennis]|nr:hypothetical protein J6590_086547 [Homalodisca vitripennis]